jgi:nuclear RNA export factor
MTGKTTSTLKAFLNSRFNREAQFLNLEAMSSDQILLKEDIKAPGTAGSPKDIGSLMWKLSSEMFPNLATISLAKNDLKSLAPVSTLPEFLPNLKNLSLQNNDIKWAKDLSFHQAKPRTTTKFNQLQELILIDNPVHDNAVLAGNEQGYRAEILARFPTLTMLDQKPVSPTEHGFAQLPGSSASKKDQVGIAQGAANAGVEVREFPLSIPNGNFVDEHAEAIVPPFLAKFFEMFDNDRSSLRSAYSNDATFTIITSPAVPPRARWQNYLNTMPRQRDLQWKSYKEIWSHNIMQLGVRPANKGFPCGQGAIVGTFNRLPKTTHPLTDPAKFAFDAWLLPNNQINATMSSADGQSTKPDALLFINVHGEFAEAPSQGLRSFSRCFVVAPVLPGSTAATLGWPCVIISDQLTVRQYAGTAAWNKDTANQNTTTPIANASAPSNVPAHLQNVQPAAGLSAEQHSMSVQLAAQTGLTYPFAVQCLNENAWNPQLAFERFQALKLNGSIPPQAFAAGS